MPDLATALATHQLEMFGKRDVIAVGVEISGAAGGLSEALTFDPVQLDIGDEITIVMRVQCSKVRFEPIKSGGEELDVLRRVHVLKAVEGGAGIIDDRLVADALAKQQDRIRLAREEAAGIQRLPTAPDDIDPEVGF